MSWHFLLFSQPVNIYLVPALCWANSTGHTIVDKIISHLGSLSILHPGGMAAIVYIITQINGWNYILLQFDISTLNERNTVL